MATNSVNGFFQLPTVGGDVNGWGTFINDNLVAIDAILGGDTDLTSLSITGGTINGTVIGGVTPADATFDALTATSVDSTPIGAITPSTAAFTTMSTTGLATLFSLNVGAATFTQAPTETVNTLTTLVVDIDPADGSIHEWNLPAGDGTVTESLSSGQNVLLIISPTTNFTIITWPTMTWINNNGVAPVFGSPAGTAFVILFKIGATLYGSVISD